MNTAEGFCGYRIQRNHYERPLASDVYFVIGMDESLVENSDYLQVDFPQIWSASRIFAVRLMKYFFQQYKA